jgi:hypothetical protein
MVRRKRKKNKREFNALRNQKRMSTKIEISPLFKMNARHYIRAAAHEQKKNARPIDISNIQVQFFSLLFLFSATGQQHRGCHSATQYG